MASGPPQQLWGKCINRASSCNIGYLAEPDILRSIYKVTNLTSIGPNGIPSKIIKALKYALTKSRAHMANLSVEKGIFPELWKDGIIILMHRKGSSPDIDSYRPIVLTSNLGKLLESIILENV